MEIRYDKIAVKYLKRLPRNLRESIIAAIEGLAETPPTGDIKVMQGYSDGRCRLRVGKYRVVYRYSTDTEEEDGKTIIIDILIVMEIGSRGDIYK